MHAYGYVVSSTLGSVSGTCAAVSVKKLVREELAPRDSKYEPFTMQKSISSIPKYFYQKSTYLPHPLVVAYLLLRAVSS
jgi:hypothetical protein